MLGYLDPHRLILSPDEKISIRLSNKAVIIYFKYNLK